ncbi:MAG TPA: ATP-binding protein [Gaiellales bacterium]|nr:ATP-binding protein [Gaiellales bacterium]
MRSLRLRLILVLAAVVATAMGVVFLYVVPTLRDNLIAGRLKRLEQVSHTEQDRDTTLGREIARLGATGVLPPATHKTVRRIGRLANARVGVFRRHGSDVEDTRVNGLAGVTRSDPIVLRAAKTGFASGHRGGMLVVAFTVGDVGVVALSQQVSDVNQTADLVERRILIAAALALLVAMLVGWASAHAVTRRLSHLEQGARRIALGEFDRPIGDQSPDELGQLGRAFDLMQTRLDRADRVRKEFVANASHELRTPLFSLSGFMELLDDEDLDDETRAAFLQQMREQVSRLTKLATDLLDLSRLDADAVAVEHEPIDMAAAARGLVREFRGLAVGHGSRISLVKPDTGLPHAIGDELRVQQVGRALLDNAIRHNPSGTQVRVAVTADNDSVRLDVADNGTAIDDETARHLFERFYRGEATSAAGSGLGLAIARELAERMDGRLELVSDDGETRFAFSLPAEQG